MAKRNSEVRGLRRALHLITEFKWTAEESREFARDALKRRNRASYRSNAVDKSKDSIGCGDTEQGDAFRCDESSDNEDDKRSS